MEQKRKEKLNRTNCSIYECNSVSSHWGAREQLSPTSMRLQLPLRPYSRWCSVGSTNWQRTIALENPPSPPALRAEPFFQHLNVHSSPCTCAANTWSREILCQPPSFASLMEEKIVSAAQSGPTACWDPFSFTSPIKTAPSGPRLQKHLWWLNVLLCLYFQCAKKCLMGCSPGQEPQNPQKNFKRTLIRYSWWCKILAHPCVVKKFQTPRKISVAWPRRMQF